MYTFDLTGFLDQVEQDYNDQLAQAQAQAEAQTLAAQDTAQQEGTPAEGQEGEDAPAEGDSAEAGDAADGESAPAETPVDPNAPQNAYLQYDATGATFIIVPDRPGKEVDWDAVAEQGPDRRAGAGD